MTLAISLLSLLASVVTCVVLIVLVRETRLSRFKLEHIENHQINPRTRIAQARFDNGPVTPTKTARQLGSMSRGQRKVVGGDSESELHRQLSGVVEETDNE